MRKAFSFQNKKSRIQDPAKGFTLIETLVFLFMFALISVVFLQSYSLGAKMIIESKNRLGATALADQKMEIIRSVAYSTIGTTTGIPPGNFQQYEDISVNTVQYHVHTEIGFVDDPFDGTAGGSPNDAIPNDYKRVRLTVSWGLGGADQSVVSYANFSPKGIETPAGGGVFSINILDAAGNGVSGATVHVQNPASSVDLTTSTNSDGNITLVGSPAGTEAYHLTVSKSGYYGAATLSPYPTSAYHPTDVHASVVNGVLNQKTIVIDRFSSVHIATQDPFGANIPNVNFHIVGGRIMGTDTSLQPVYGLDQNSATNGSGEKTLSDQSYGPYTLTFTSPSQYEFYALVPEETTPDKFSVDAGDTKNVTGVFLDKALGSVKVAVTSSTGGAAVPGATAHLTDAALSYDATRTTDQYGFAYFPSSLPALADGTYSLEVSAPGFSSDTSTLTVSGGLVKTDVSLNTN